MLERAKIEELFRDQESDRIERKSSVADADKICEAICAFSNDLPNHRGPGLVIVGQRPDGSSANITIDERLLETLGGWRSDGNILPFPAMTVTRETIDGCTVALIVVQPTDNPPVRYKGRAWIRVGPRRAIATPHEEKILVERRRTANLPFDQQPVSGTTIESDLDLARFRLEFLPAMVSADTLAQNQRTVEDQLRASRLINADGIPTTSGVLLIGKDPQAWFPGAYIQWRRIDGTEIVDETLDERAITGTVLDQARRVDEFMAAANSVSLSVREDRHTRRAAYPTIALQQIVRNALLHRTYEASNAPVRISWLTDRVEFLSPGGPFGTVTAENFGQPGITDYRNPTLAEAFRGYGLAERFGVGLSLVRKSARENGNPPPQFATPSNFVNVTLRVHP